MCWNYRLAVAAGQPDAGRHGRRPGGILKYSNSHTSRKQPGQNAARGQYFLKRPGTALPGESVYLFHTVRPVHPLPESPNPSPCLFVATNVVENIDLMLPPCDWDNITAVSPESTPEALLAETEIRVLLRPADLRADLRVPEPSEQVEVH